MKTKLQKSILTLSMVLLLIASSTQQAEARKFIGWDTTSDGYNYQDSEGCMHWVYEEAYYVLGIKVSSREVDVVVACPDGQPTGGEV